MNHAVSGSWRQLVSPAEVLISVAGSGNLWRSVGVKKGWAMRVGVILFLLFSAPLAFGQVYQWVDENGVRHFSDQPPPDGRESERARTGSLSTYSPAPVPRQTTPTGTTQPAASAPRVVVVPEYSTEQPQLGSGRNEGLCQFYLDQLESIRVQLRSGYREPSGNRLRAQRRDLSTKYRSECT
jgi:hypothetical protein